jgi:hypothetical protein
LLTFGSFKIDAAMETKLVNYRFLKGPWRSGVDSCAPENLFWMRQVLFLSDLVCYLNGKCIPELQAWLDRWYQSG